MNEPVTIRDVMTRSFVGVTEGDQVAGLAQLMADEPTDYAVVLRGSRAIGLVHATDIVRVIANERDPATTSVREVMRTPVRDLPVDRPLAVAIDALADPDKKQVVITDDESVIGVLSESDVVSVYLSFRDLESDHDIVTPVATTAHTGHQSADSDTMQGVCEVCGSLSRQLAHQNGQFVCAECISI